MTLMIPIPWRRKFRGLLFTHPRGAVSVVVALFVAFVPRSFAAEEVTSNRLMPEEKELGFELLFNGRDFDGWKNPGGWVVECGAFAFKESGGGLVYRGKQIPDDFELRFQWKVADGSNSGVSCRPGLYEYQILDNRKNGDGKNPRTSAASLYFCMAPSHDATKPVGEWNTSRIIYKGTVLQHWLNGQKVVDFDYKDPRWAANVELLRQRGGTDLGARGAYLRLQNHGHPVWYRGIKLRTLGERDKLDRTPIHPAEISPQALESEQRILRYYQRQRRERKERLKRQKASPTPAGKRGARPAETNEGRP